MNLVSEIKGKWGRTFQKAYVWGYSSVVEHLTAKSICAKTKKKW